MSARGAWANAPAPAGLAWGQRDLPGWIGPWLLRLWWLWDRLVPKRDDHWAFFTHPLKSSQFVENSRAVFEQVKRDPGVRKIVFTRYAAVQLDLEDACNTEVVNLKSLGGLRALARCGVLLLTNSVGLDLLLRWDATHFSHPRPDLRRRIVLNLWHGIPLKRLFALANPEQRRHGDRNAYRRAERSAYAGLIASSDADRNAMAAIFHPIQPDQVWATGLPRNDFLAMAEAELPGFLREGLRRVRALKRGRRLVVYAPTYRDATAGGTDHYPFDEVEVARLRALLVAHDAVLGVRMHYLRNGKRQAFGIERHIDGDRIVDLGHEVSPEIAPLLREADAVITDYSSVYIDALYLDRPVFGFAYDLDHYREHQNGLLYDMALAFPGPVQQHFDEVLASLQQWLSAPHFVPGEGYRQTQRLFFNRRDDGNAGRVLATLRAEISRRAGRG